MEPMMVGAPASRAAWIPSSSSSREVCVSMMMASAPASTRAVACSKSVAHLGLREIAIGFQEAAEGADIADDESIAAVEGVAGDFHAGAVDFGHMVSVGVAVQHNARTAEGVGEEAIRNGPGIAALDGGW